MTRTSIHKEGKIINLKLETVCKDEFHTLNNNIWGNLNPELKTNYEKVKEYHIESNPVIGNNNICPNSKCKSNNLMTYLCPNFVTQSYDSTYQNSDYGLTMGWDSRLNVITIDGSMKPNRNNYLYNNPDG